jgi:5-methylcytosine-specific restriction endonuclease McrA
MKKTKAERIEKTRRRFKSSYDALLSLGYSFDKPPRYQTMKSSLEWAKWQSCNSHRRRLVNLGESGWIVAQGIPLPTIERLVKQKPDHNKKPTVRRSIPSNVAWMPRDEWEKQTAKFYASQAWRELRYEALRNSDGSCCCCGAKKADGAQLHVDHIKPRSKYPELQLDIENLQILCQDCNIGKSNYYDDNWKAKMENGTE